MVWGRLRLDGTTLHGLSMVDACIVGLAFMDKVYPDANKRRREYKRLAELCRIEIVEDPDLVAERHRQAMAVVEADFGIDS